MLEITSAKQAKVRRPFYWEKSSLHISFEVIRETKTFLSGDSTARLDKLLIAVDAHGTMDLLRSIPQRGQTCINFHFDGL